MKYIAKFYGHVDGGKFGHFSVDVDANDMVSAMNKAIEGRKSGSRLLSVERADGKAKMNLPTKEAK